MSGFWNDNSDQEAGENKKPVPTMADIPDFLQRTNWPYFVTGSVRFGCAHRGSDLDIAFPIMARDDVLELAGEYTESEYNRGIKIQTENGVPVNFVFLHPLDYAAWSLTAKMIKASGIFTKDKNLPRPTRHAVHEGICAMNKAALAAIAMVTKENFEEYA